MPTKNFPGGTNPSVKASWTGPWGSAGNILSTTTEPTAKQAHDGTRQALGTSAKLWISGKGGSCNVQFYYGEARGPTVTIPSGGSAAERTINFTDFAFVADGGSVSFGFRLISGAAYFGRDSSGSTTGPSGGKWDGDLGGSFNYAEVPSKPGTPSVVDAGETSIEVKWTAPTDNGGSSINGYRVQRATNSAFTTGLVSADKASNQLSHVFSGLAVNTTYYFRVLASNGVTTATGKYSPYSGTRTQKTASTPVGAPTLPTDADVTQTGPGAATVTWGVPTDNGGSAISGYDVQVALDEDFTVGVSTVSKTNAQFSHTFTGLSGTVWFRVRAKNASQTGNYTDGFDLLVTAGGAVKVWDGSAWATKPLKVWDGSAWVEKPLKRYDGASWITVT